MLIAIQYANGAFCCDFKAFRTIADHRSLSQVSPPKSQQCGQSATHDGMFSYSPAMLIAAIVFRNIQLRNFTMLQTACKSHYKWLRYYKSGIKILSMLNFPSQHIACDFYASQLVLNPPSQVCSIATCGLGYRT